MVVLQETLTYKSIKTKYMKKVLMIFFLFITVVGYSQLSVNSAGKLIGIANTVLITASDTTQLLAKRDTAKMLNGVRASIELFSSNSYKQMIADSCYSTVIDFFTVNNGSIGSVTVTYGKTIYNARVQITPVFTTQITAGLGDFVWYVHNVITTQCEISVHNNAATGLISIGFDVRVCPDGY